MKILIAIDDSICSAAVIERVEHTIWPPGADVRIVTVIERDEALIDFEYREFTFEKICENRRLLLAEFENRLRSAKRFDNVEIDILEGDPEDRVLALATAWNADLIVLGSRGKHGFDRFLLGSVAMNVLLRAHCSVEIVKGRYTPREHLNLLIAYDGSRHADKALQALSASTWARRSRVKLISVVPPLLEELFGLNQLGSFDPDDLSVVENIGSEPTVMSKIAATLKDLHDVFGRENTEVTMVRGDARESILRESEEWPAHLIIMGSHGRTGIAKFLLGSVSHAISLYANCSVRIVR